MPHAEQDGDVGEVAVEVEVKMVVGVEYLQHSVVEVDVDQDREPKQKT